MAVSAVPPVGTCQTDPLGGVICGGSYMVDHIWVSYMVNHIWSTIRGASYMGNHMWHIIYGQSYVGSPVLL